MNAAWREVPTLTGRHVQLRPLVEDDADALESAAADGDLSKLWYTSVPGPGQASAYIRRALDEHAQGRTLPFAVLDARASVVGSTRCFDLEPEHRRLEIGYTWYSKRVQRSALNTEAKRLLLAHAFERMDCVAVEFRTHWFNFASRAAILRLGAKQDGVLRNHRIMPDGSLRDTVVFSIIGSEWPVVRRHLDVLLHDPRSGA